MRATPCLILLACLASLSAAAQAVTTRPTGETQVVVRGGAGDQDVALWPNSANPAQSLLVVTDSTGVLTTYRMDGTEFEVFQGEVVFGVDVRDGGAPMVWFLRDNGARVDLYSLSHNEQQAVLFAVVYKRFGLNRSILLIDEPELHIHPQEQRRFLDALAGLGGDAQIIATTSSSHLLESAPHHAVILLDARPG